jgi:hypothetical protein
LSWAQLSNKKNQINSSGLGAENKQENLSRRQGQGSPLDQRVHPDLGRMGRQVYSSHMTELILQCQAEESVFYK